MNSLVFIGPCGGGGMPTNGASVKNYYLTQVLKERFVKVKVLDTEYWRKKPFILLKILFAILMNPHAKFVVSADNMSSYHLFNILGYMHLKRDVYYWVIGGSIAQWIKDGKVKSATYRVLRMFLVEGDSMKCTLNELGFDNVIVVPNFKNIKYIPAKHRSVNDDDPVKFVFISRIIPQKGCDYIFEAVRMLDLKYDGRFYVDFYGDIAEDYRDLFLRKVQLLPNVEYKGFLDLRDCKNYDILSGYDVMLFPTFWDGEGFPGIIIDAYIAGLPVIATDWSLNHDIIEDNKTGWIIETKDATTLLAKMEYAMTHKAELLQMSESCQSKAMDYDIHHVLDNKLFEAIGL